MIRNTQTMNDSSPEQWEELLQSLRKEQQELEKKIATLNEQLASHQESVNGAEEMNEPESAAPDEGVREVHDDPRPRGTVYKEVEDDENDGLINGIAAAVFGLAGYGVYRLWKEL